MSMDPRKRQKKLAKKDAKRKEKRHDLIKESNVGMPTKLALAAKLPILETLASETLWTQGLGTVTFTRNFPHGMVASARFLIDTGCLGVKDVVLQVISLSQYRELQQRASSQFQSRAISPADVVKIVEDSVAYARTLGLHPGGDYARSKILFADIDPSVSKLALEFGRGGKPFFVSGPMDTPARCQRILRTLEESCGPNGYHFMMGVGPNARVEEGDIDIIEGEEK